MDGKTLDIRQQNIEKLKSIFPEIFSEDKVDLKRLEKLIGEDYLAEKNHYELSWMGKADARYEIKQQSQATLNLEDIYIHDSLKEEYKNKNIENVFIEGENLEVLKVLQRSYFNKVKMIYIDPPYNTGNDSFVYPDNYADRKDEYEIDSGKRDENGNLNKLDAFKAHTKENGQYHSKWLSMMYPRLYLARNLLKEDGVIFISIDDNEVANLRILCDEIFGEENFESYIIPIVNPGGRDYNQIAVTNEYILAYKKTEKNQLLEISKEINFKYNDSKGGYDVRELRNRNPKFNRLNRPNLFYPFYINPLELNNDGYCNVSINKDEKYHIEVLPYNSLGEESVWRWGTKKAKENIILNNFDKTQLLAKQKKDGNWNIYEKSRKSTTKVKSVWSETEMRTENGTREIRELLKKSYFTHPKPNALIKKCLKISTVNSDLILDFFAGSGTTAQAVMELNKEDGGNRKFILVQIPEPLDKKTEAYKAGYNTIADICKERIKKSIDKIINEDEKTNQSKIDFDENKSEQLLAFKHFKLNDSNFLKWNNNVKSVEDLQKQILLHAEPSPIISSDINKIYELLLQQGDTLTEKIEEKIIDNQTIYIVSGSTIFFFKNYSEKLLEFFTEYRPIRVICLDECFEDSQELTNFELQLKELKIDVKVV